VILRLENAGCENEYRGHESVCRGNETDYRDCDSDCRSNEIACRVSMGGKVGTGRESAYRGRGNNIEAFKNIIDVVRLFVEAMRVLAESL
jgi:hypothetical protein